MGQGSCLVDRGSPLGVLVGVGQGVLLSKPHLPPFPCRGASGEEGWEQLAARLWELPGSFLDN